MVTPRTRGNSVIPSTTNQRLIDNATGTRAKECYLNLWIIRKQLVLRESVPRADVVILPQRRRCDGTRGPGDGDVDEEWLRKMFFFLFRVEKKAKKKNKQITISRLTGWKSLFFLSLVCYPRWEWGFRSRPALSTRYEECCWAGYVCSTLSHRHHLYGFMVMVCRYGIDRFWSLKWCCLGKRKPIPTQLADAYSCQN